MTDRPPAGTTVDHATGIPPAAAQIDQGSLRQLAEATTVEEFCAAWLDLQARIIGGVSGGCVALDRGEGTPPGIVALWPSHFAEGDLLASAVERVLAERKGVLMRRDAGEATGQTHDDRVLMAYPVWLEDALRGVAAFLITARPQAQTPIAMRQLQWGISWVQNWLLRQTVWPEVNAKKRMTAAMELAALALEHERFQEAATAFVTDLATHMECDRVSIGYRRRGRFRVRALSHSADFRRQMNLVRSIESAMTESSDQQAILVYPEPESGSHHVLRCHADLAREHGDRAVCSVPFVGHDGSVLGVLTLERSPARPFDRRTVDTCDGIAALVGPMLDDKRRGSQSLWATTWERLVRQARLLFGPRHLGRKAIAAAAVALIVFFTFAKATFRVTSKVTLEGEVQRVVVAPYHGFIHSAPVRPGDIVDEGQVLCQLDDRDLQLETSKWTSERAQYLVEHRKAMAGGELASMNVLSRKINQTEAQLDLLHEQIARARIVAPFRGVLVSGDLSQSLGAPVDAGQILFQLAPLDSYRLMLKVNESDINYVRPGEQGDIVLTALPQDSFPLIVTKMTPVSLSEGGSSYFKVEARLENTTDRLRPGMEGIAKVRVDRRRLIWIWTHDAIEWARLFLWTWMP